MRHALLAVTALAVTACSFIPTQTPPVVEAPANWSSRPGEASAPDIDTRWWESFGSSELNGYIERALTSNADVSAALARIGQADALSAVAGAPLLPTVAMTATGLRERVQTTSAAYVNFHQTQPVLSASYVLDFWGKNRAAAQAAQSSARASRFDRQTVQTSVVSSVAVTYFQSVALANRATVARSNHANAERVLRGLRAQREAGTVTALEVTQQETTVSTLAAAIAPLEQQLRQSVDALAVLVGELPQSMSVPGADLNTIGSPEVKPLLPADVLARRPDVASIEAQLAAANANIGVARAAFLPNVSLTTTTGFASSIFAQVFSGNSRIWIENVGITTPLFDNGALQGQLSLAISRHAELMAGYRKTVLTALANVEDSLSAVANTTEQVRRQTDAVRSATRGFQIAKTQLDAGTTTVIAVLNSQTALLNARDALLQAKLANLQAMVNLYGALGGGWSSNKSKEQG